MELPFELPQAHKDRIAADEAREAREWEQKLADQADRREMTARMAEIAERAFQYQTGHSREEWREAMGLAALARVGRDPSAEWGSAQRQAIFVDGRELRPREQATGPVTMRPDSLQAQLARAREISGDPFMARMVAEFDRRRGGGGRPAISRSEAEDGIDCLDCLEQGATPRESALLHLDPDGPPRRTVPDYAPMRSRRVSGTGWPQGVICR